MGKEKIRYEENLYRNRSGAAHNIKMDSNDYFRGTLHDLWFLIVSISPIQPISRDGDLMPKKSQIPSQMEEIHPDTLSQSHDERD